MHLVELSVMEQRYQTASRVLSLASVGQGHVHRPVLDDLDYDWVTAKQAWEPWEDYPPPPDVPTLGSKR